MPSSNPSESVLSKVSKVTLKNKNKNFLNSLKVYQWKDTDSVVNWFNAIKSKPHRYFIQLKIAKFYHSIMDFRYSNTHMY